MDFVHLLCCSATAAAAASAQPFDCDEVGRDSGCFMNGVLWCPMDGTIATNHIVYVYVVVHERHERSANCAVFSLSSPSPTSSSSYIVSFCTERTMLLRRNNRCAVVRIEYSNSQYEIHRAAKRNGKSFRCCCSPNGGFDL